MVLVVLSSLWLLPGAAKRSQGASSSSTARWPARVPTAHPQRSVCDHGLDMCRRFAPRLIPSSDVAPVQVAPNGVARPSTHPCPYPTCPHPAYPPALHYVYQVDMRNEAISETNVSNAELARSHYLLKSAPPTLDEHGVISATTSNKYATIKLRARPLPLPVVEHLQAHVSITSPLSPPPPPPTWCARRHCRKSSMVRGLMHPLRVERAQSDHPRV